MCDVDNADDAELLSSCEKSNTAVTGFMPWPRKYRVFPTVQGNQIQLHLMTLAQQVEYSDMSLPLYNAGNETIQVGTSRMWKDFSSKIIQAVRLLFLSHKSTNYSPYQNSTNHKYSER